MNPQAYYTVSILAHARVSVTCISIHVPLSCKILPYFWVDVRDVAQSVIYVGDGLRT